MVSQNYWQGQTSARSFVKKIFDKRDAKQAKNITVNITKLVENLMVNAQNLNESAGKIREEVAKALIDAVRDFELQAG